MEYIQQQLVKLERLLLEYKGYQKSGELRDDLAFVNGIFKDILDGHQVDGEMMRKCNFIYKVYSGKLKELKIKIAKHKL